MISIVIPAHNEEDVLPVLFERLNTAAQSWGDDYEVIIVDDGSTDATPLWLDRFHAEDDRWKYLRFSRNFGHQAAVSAGIHYSTGDAVIVMDADLQDPPEVLDQFLDKWREGYQVVYAVRTKRKEHFFKRTAYSLFYRVLRSVADIEIPLDSGDFCLMDRTVVDVLRSLPERTRFVRGLRSWAGFRQTGLPYERDARLAGDVKYTLPKLMRLAADGVFSFSNWPLRFSSWMGVALCMGSLSMMTLVVAWWATNVEVFGMAPGRALGWTSLCSLILLVSGVQLLFLGVIGEYLARVFDEVKARPSWIVAQARGIETPYSPSFGWHTVPHREPFHHPLAKAG